MATFRVGQRVVLVRGIDLASRAQNYGLAGRIRLFGNWPVGTLTSDGTGLVINCDCVVDWSDGDNGLQNTAQLEPIIPEGAAPSEFTTLADLLSSLEVTA